MKKIVIGFAIVLLGTISFFTYKYFIKTNAAVQEKETIKEFNITLKLDYGNGNTNSYNIKAKEGDTAFSVMKSEVEKQGIYLETIQYDFGVFVKKVGDLESGAKKSWIYYVNDVSGDKAADLYTLKENDTVLWKYETPTY